MYLIEVLESKRAAAWLPAGVVDTLEEAEGWLARVAPEDIDAWSIRRRLLPDD